MRPSPIESSFYKENRERFSQRLQSNTIAVFNSNVQMPTNADGTLPFVQNSDLFYLTGIDQENTTLILFPDAVNPKFRAVLFIRYADEQVLTWEGHKLSKEAAREISGIESVLWQGEFERVFKSLAFEASCICLNSNEHKRADISIKNKDEQFVEWCREKFPLHSFQRAAPILHELRTKKHKLEIAVIQKACDITKSGFLRLARFLRPGVFEYELQAELAHEFLKSGSRGFAYEPIIASGQDSCVLHYITNHKECKAGDIVLLDVAAEYGNYKSDLTRVLPVNGKFTPRQKDIYRAVLNMFNYAKSLMQPGTVFEEYTQAVAEKAEEELIKLGLLKLADVKRQDKERPLYRKYFMHGVSHFLGLDVHDVGNLSGKMAEGMLLTCEPGIYVREESIGVRLENNILITESGHLDLMSSIPIEPEEIEVLMEKIV